MWLIVIFSLGPLWCADMSRHLAITGNGERSLLGSQPGLPVPDAPVHHRSLLHTHTEEDCRAEVAQAGAPSARHGQGWQSSIESGDWAEQGEGVQNAHRPRSTVRTQLAAALCDLLHHQDWPTPGGRSLVDQSHCPYGRAHCPVVGRLQFVRQSHSVLLFQCQISIVLSVHVDEVLLVLQHPPLGTLSGQDQWRWWRQVDGYCCMRNKPNQELVRKPV